MKYLILLMGAIAPLMLCEVRATQAQNLTKPAIEASPQPATTVNEWLRQIAQASVAQITAVQLNPTSTGIEVILETAGQLEPTTSVVDPLFSYVATGEERSRGVELDVIGEILPGWNIIASYAYIDGEVTDDLDRTLIGNRLFNTPEHSASLWTTYEIQQGDLQGLGFGIGFDFVGEREGDLANSFQVDSSFLTNAAIFYRRNNWRLALNVKNLFDNDYIEATNNSRAYAIEPGDPFTIIGSLSVQF